MFEQYSDVLTVNDLCEILKIGKNTAYKLLDRKEITSIMVAGKYRIPKKFLIDYITKNVA